MTSLGSFERLLWLFSTAVLVGLIGRLWQQGLYRNYLSFFAYLLVDLAQAVALYPLVSFRNAYAYTYLALEAVKCFLWVLITLELASLVLRSYPGIATLSRRVVHLAVGVALAMSALTLVLDLGREPGGSRILYYFRVFERSVACSVLLFLLLIACFLLWFPLRLPRNVVVYFSGFCLYFLSKAFLLLAANLLGPQTVRTVSAVVLGVATACQLGWLFLLSRAGEETTAVVGHCWQPEQEGRLIQQLDSINSSLLRSTRK